MANFEPAFEQMIKVVVRIVEGCPGCGDALSVVVQVFQLAHEKRLL